MGTFPDPTRLPGPAWLAGHSTPVIDALLEDQSDGVRRLYRRYLADEVRAMAGRSGETAAWRAFDRAIRDDLARVRGAVDQ
jgi:hypothetical protein